MARIIAVGQNPTAVTVDTQTERAFVLNLGTLDRFGNPAGPGSVSVLDTGSGDVLGTTIVGTDPNAAAVDEASGRVFVVNGGSFDSYGRLTGPGSVSVLDARTGRVLRTVAGGVAPGAVEVDQQTERVFVINRGTGGNNRGSVSMLDARTGSLMRTVRVGVYPASAAIDVPLGRLFVANLVSNTVSVLDARRAMLLLTIMLGQSPGTAAAMAVDARTQRVLVLSLPSHLAGEGGGVLGHVTTLNVTTGRLVRVVPLQEPTALGADQWSGHAFVSGGTVRSGSVSMLDTRSGTVLTTRHMKTYPGAMAVDPQGHRAFVITTVASNRGGVFGSRGNVDEVDTRTGLLECTRGLGMRPTAIVIDARTQHIFVVNSGANSVSMLPATC
jgi:DNA-binding beta-propeller fold protein YncE